MLLWPPVLFFMNGAAGNKGEGETKVKADYCYEIWFYQSKTVSLLQVILKKAGGIPSRSGVFARDGSIA